MSQHNDGILGLAKLTEDNIRAQHHPKSTFVPFRNMVSQRHPIRSTPRPTPIKDLSKAKMRAHTEKWLCYNCDGKFTQGHQCTEQKLYLLDVVSPPALEICEAAQDPVDDQVDIQQPLVDPHSHDEHPKISLHPLVGVIAPQTMQVKVFFKNIPLTILIDSGSTHNFIEPQITKQTDSFVHPCSIFKVMVANGSTLPWKG